MESAAVRKGQGEGRAREKDGWKKAWNPTVWGAYLQLKLRAGERRDSGFLPLQRYLLKRPHPKLAGE